jgi:hypothetical protein
MNTAHRRRFAPVVVLMIFALVMAQRAASHIRAVDLLLVFGSGTLFGVSLARLLQQIRAGQPSES